MRTALPLALLLAAGTAGAALAQEQPLRSGTAAFGAWGDDAPGVRRLIRPTDSPPPGAGSGAFGAKLDKQGTPTPPKAPSGFTVELFAKGLNGPRSMRLAPNGDVFLAETRAQRVLVFKAADVAKGIAVPEVFAEGIPQAFGMLFYPADNPKWLYVGAGSKVVRLPYTTGATKAGGAAETIVDGILTSDHITRDLMLAPDGRRILLSIGSGSNVAEDMGPKPANFVEDGVGGAWGKEAGRAVVRIMEPDGKGLKNYVTGIRNCTSMAHQPNTTAIWCVVNERDQLGDNTPPEYATALKPGAYYGWPWYDPLGREDPRHAGERPDLKGKVTTPDVLFQAHSAPLGIAFYDGAQFPKAYRGDAFVTFRGSWNRTDRTGYKVVRMRFSGAKATGEYDDFLTGFVTDKDTAWGRPVGVIAAKDGSLLVSEDGSSTIWRVRWTGGR